MIRSMGDLATGNVQGNEPAVTVRPHACAIKSILIYLCEDASAECLLQSAVALAKACNAHIRLLQITPVASYRMVELFAGGSIGEDIIAAIEGVSAAFRARVEERLANERIRWSSESITASVAPELSRRAAVSEMTFIGRSVSETEFSRSGPSLLNELICKTHSPLFVQGDRYVPLDPSGCAIIAWNGTDQAANAVRQSIEMIRMASEVRIVRFAHEKGCSPTDQRMLDYLSFHGISARLDVRPAHAHLEEELTEYAVNAGADYLVVGAYSHSRAGEFLFGGVTRHLLQKCPVSLVIAH